MGPAPIARNSHREDLIDAAEAIVTEQGVGELTLERVAARAGVTKGGLIYHFKTKDDLLAALVQSMIDEWDQRTRAKASESGSNSSAMLLALINDTFDMQPSEKQLMRNLLAAASSYPHLLGPVRELYDRTYRDFAGSSAQTGIALVITAAIDGISLLELLDFHHFSEDQRKAMRKALQTLAKDLT